MSDPWDHNGECRYCDEQGMHRADCTWLVEMLKKLDHFQTLSVIKDEQLFEAHGRLNLMATRVEELEAALDPVQRAEQAQNRWLELRQRIEALEQEKGALELLVKELIASAKSQQLVDEAAREFERVGHELAAKIQFLVDWADQNHLLEEHLFTFPDGDTWTAKGAI